MSAWTANIIAPVERNRDKDVKTSIFMMIFIVSLAGGKGIANPLPAIGITHLIVFTVTAPPPVITPQRAQ